MLLQLYCMHKLLRFSIVDKDNLFTQFSASLLHHVSRLSSLLLVYTKNQNFTHQTKDKGMMILYLFTFELPKKDEKNFTHLW